MNIEEILTGAAVMVGAVLICVAAKIAGTAMGATPDGEHGIAAAILVLFSL